MPDPSSNVLHQFRKGDINAFARLPPRLRIAAALAAAKEQPHKEVAASFAIA